MKLVVITPAALRQLGKLGTVEVRRIRAKIEAYASGQSADVTAMKAMAGAYRMRIGDWRVVFEETETAVIIIRVGHRSTIYD